MKRLPAYALFFAVFAAGLVGCKSIGGISGAVTAAAAGAVSANPAVGVAVGIGTKAIVDESVNAALRYWSEEEQTQIVGNLGVGQHSAWEVRHPVPYDNKKGTVQVTRIIVTPFTTCKEALFSAELSDASATPRSFLTSVCKSETGWRWAAAEPAVARWGALQ